MSVFTSSRGDPRARVFPFTRQLFESPHPAGRKITAGFTYLQRITKPATFDVWFPDALQRQLEARIAVGQIIGDAQFPAQWAAVRQFELLHESGNHKIYDLNPENLKRSMLDLARSMRAGGYRVTVATLGCYDEAGGGDELEILDKNLQERIAQMIHMLYLDTQSEEENAENDAKLAAHKWDYRQDIPHVGMVLGAHDLFSPVAKKDEAEGKKRKGKSESGGGIVSAVNRKHKLARQFFRILNALPQNHIVHDTVIGLQLPELNGEYQWNYIAHPEETLSAFNHVLSSLFDKFNGINLGRLQGREEAPSEIKASTIHLRGYGDRMTDSSQQFFRNLSLALG